VQITLVLRLTKSIYMDCMFNTIRLLSIDMSKRQLKYLRFGSKLVSSAMKIISMCKGPWLLFSNNL
jgi:hypothetical protein